jgi:hypothetical protein
MLAKAFVGLLAVAAISYGGAVVYLGHCPFACHSRCGGTQETTTPCCQTPLSSSGSTEQTPCCENENCDVASGVVGVCGTAVVAEPTACPFCKTQSTASQQP